MGVRIKTSEEIREYLRQFKEQKLLEKKKIKTKKEPKKKTKIKTPSTELIQAIKLANKIKALQAIKNTQPLQQSTNTEKCPQKALKCEIGGIYGNSLIERFTSDEDLWLTREELQAVEGTKESGYGIINWEVFDRLTKQQLI